MFVTTEQLRDEIERLGGIVEDICDIATRIKSGARHSTSLSFLEKEGLISLSDSIIERVEKFNDLYTDVRRFTIIDNTPPIKKEAEIGADIVE